MGSSSKRVTVGYKYNLGMHLALCHGPIDKITRIQVDKRTAWEGEATGGSITIDAGDLFGGDEREGGISGAVDIEMGGSAQTQNSYLQDQLGEEIPAFRGVTCAVLKQCYVGNNPYLKPWSFRAERIHSRQNGIAQWYDEKAEIPSIKIFFDGSNWTDDMVCVPYFALSETINHLFSGEGAGTIDGISGATYDYPLGEVAATISADPSDVFIIRKRAATSDATKAYVMGWESDPEPYPDAWATNAFVVTTPDDASTLHWDSAFDTVDAAYNYALSQDDVYLSGYSSYKIWLLDNITAGGGDINPQGGGRFYVDVFQVDGEPGDQCYSSYSCNDMNPAHIIRECLTDPNWGMGYNDSDIDDDAFMAAADALYAEFFGMSLLWSQEIELSEFIAEILRHIDAVLYVDRTTGKFVLKLIRDDNAQSDMVVLDESNVISVTNANRPAIGDLVASVTVNYWSRDTGETASITKHNQALFAIQTGGGGSATVQYPGITSPPLASRVCLRDLTALSTPLLSCTVEVQRVAESLNIGDAFILDWPDLGIDGVVMRVQQMTLGDGVNNTIHIEALEDVFKLPLPTEAGNGRQGGLWTDPINQDVLPAYPRVVTELPYRELVGVYGQINTDAILEDDPDAGYLLASGGRQGGEINALMHVDSGAGYTLTGTMDFCPVAFYDAPVWYSDTIIYLHDAVDLDLVEIGTVARIGAELVRIDGVHEDSNGAYITVGRGVYDTVPLEHASSGDQAVVFWGGEWATDGERYVASDEVDVKLRPTLGSNQLLIEDAPVDTVTFSSRAVRPYPPGDLRLDTYSYPRESNTIEWTGFNTVTWKHRDRLQQTGAYIHDYTAGDIGPEAGTEYLVSAKTYDENGELIGTLLSPVNVGADTSYSFGSGTVSPPPGTLFVKVFVYSLRDGYESRQGAEVKIYIASDSAEPVDAKVLIQSITHSSSDEFDFDSIPGTYKRLVIEGTLRTSSSTANWPIIAVFNTDTTASNYSYLSMYGQGGVTTNVIDSGTQNVIGSVAHSAAPSDSYTSIRIVIENYADATTLKTAYSETGYYYGTDTARIEQTTMTSAITAALTRVRIRASSHPTHKLIGTLHLYGEN